MTMNPTATAAIKTSTPLRTGHVIMADGSKTAPTQIEIMKAGVWPASSVKGPLTITTADLQEFKSNFDAGVGMPDSLKQLPIDFSHNDWKEAAGWITALDVVGESLMATVEWSADGKEALEGGMYKCISPSFWPACCGEWYDPEDSETTARNVLVGAGLTNIPFFKDLQPIMASSTSGKDGKRVQENIIYITADEKEQKTMTLDEVRVLDADKLTDEHKKVLTDNKAELSAEELKKFDMDDKPADPVADPADPTKTKKEDDPVADPELAAIAASVKSGEYKVVKAATYDKLEADVKEMKRKEIEASVDTHIGRGAIKADQKKTWADLIEANATMQDTLAALPDNPLLASEQGSSTQAGNASAHEALSTAAEKIVADTASTANPVKFNEAFKQAMSANPELVKELNAERE